MNKLITLYHGSKRIVDVPTFGLGRRNNDLGLGFYCTESDELVKEWAASSLRDGFLKPLYPGYGASEHAESEWSGIYDSQLDHRSR